jgi:hypothetical protein
MKEARMRWYVNVMRRNDNKIVRKILKIQENRRGGERSHQLVSSAVEKGV